MVLDGTRGKINWRFLPFLKQQYLVVCLFCHSFISFEAEVSLSVRYRRFFNVTMYVILKLLFLKVYVGQENRNKMLSCFFFSL